MKKKAVEIRVVDHWPSDEIIQLYKVGGWWKESYDPSKIQLMISGSFVFAVVVDSKTGKAVGMGRVLSDGVSDAYIQDMIILPEYRKQGIGKTLLLSLVQRCLDQGIVWIGLIAEPGSNGFYRREGFQQMNNYTPMLFKKDG